MRAVAYTVICDCGAEMSLVRYTPLPALLVCRNEGSGCVKAGQVIEAPTQLLDLAGDQLSAPAGAQGPEGPQGPAGDEGPAGAQGAAGPKGDKGDKGDAGAAGQQGQQGQQGPQGLQGDAGAAGPQGDPGAQGPAGPAGGLSLPLVADNAGVTLTNMAAALAFFNGSHRHALKADLSQFTQVRLVVNKQANAGAAASKLILRYRTAFDVTPANWLDIGTSEVNCALTGQNTVVASAWINLVAGAKADVFICPLMSGGDGAADPVVGNVVAQFK